MGISQQIGASSLIKAGVVDNTANRPASPYEGQVIFQKDTDQLLVWNGTAWVIPNSPAQNPQGLELVKSQAVGSGVPSVNVTNAFSSLYDNYYVTWTGGTVNSPSSLAFQFGPSSVSGYASSYYAVVPAGSFTSTLYLTTNNGAAFTNAGMGDTNLATFEITLFGPYKAQYTTAKISWIDSRDNFAWGQGGGVHRVASAFSDFQISAGGNSMTGGTVRVYGYRNS